MGILDIVLVPAQAEWEIGMAGFGNTGRINFLPKKKITHGDFQVLLNVAVMQKEKIKSALDLGLFSPFCNCGNDTAACLTHHYFKAALK